MQQRKTFNTLIELFFFTLHATASTLEPDIRRQPDKLVYKTRGCTLTWIEDSQPQAADIGPAGIHQ